MADILEISTTKQNRNSINITLFDGIAQFFSTRILQFLPFELVMPQNGSE